MYDIVKPEKIENPEIKLDYTDMNGIGIRLEFDYTDEEGKKKKFSRKTNRVIELSEDGEVSIKIKNTMKTVKNLYQYSPDLIFLTSGNPEFFNALKSSFEDKEKNYNFLYGLVSFDNDKIFILPQPEINLKTNIKQEEVRQKDKDLKVYETPQKVFDFFTDLIDKEMREIVIEEAVKKILKVKKSDDLYNMQNALIMSSVEIINKAINENDFETIKKEIGESNFEKNKELIEFLTKIPDKDIFKFLKEHERELTLFKLEKVLNVKPLFLDFQAGSGVILNSLKEKGFDKAVLTGTELRNIENNDPSYQVVTGSNFSLLKNTYNQILSNENRKHMIRSIFNYTNPPYTTDDTVARESIDTIKDGSIVFGLYPTKMLPYLKDRIDGVIYEIPKEATGYTDPNTPQKFLLIAGTKLSERDIKNIQSRQAKSKCEYIEVETTDLKTLKPRPALKQTIRDNLTYSISTDYTNFQKDFKTAIENTNERYKNLAKIVNTLENHKKDILNSFLPFDDLKKNKVFPDTRFFSYNNKTDYYTFDEVAQNIPLLNFYKKVNPELFLIVKKIAEDIKYPLPDIKEEEEFRYSFTNTAPQNKDIVTNTNLGMMRLKYYPDIINISDKENKEILVNILNKYIEENNLEIPEKSLNALELLINKASSIVLKNEKTSKEKTIYNNEVLVFVDKFGQDLGKFEITPTEFYKLLEKEGYFNLDDYIELAELKTDEYDNIVEKFTDYIEDVKQEIVAFNIENFKEFYNETNQEAIFEEFNKDIKAAYISYMNMHKKITELKRKKANGENLSAEELNQLTDFTDKRNGVIIDFANKYHFKEIFSKKFEFIDPKNNIKKVVNKYAANLDKNEVEEINKLINAHFKNREITFFEIERPTFFAQLNENYNLEDKMDFENFMIDIEDALSDAYKVKKQIYTGYVRLADILVTGVFPLKELLRRGNKEKARVLFEHLFIRKLNLQPHQFNEAIRYLAVSDERKLEMLFWEMRAGKTRTMLATGLLNALKHNKDIDFIAETANLNDIALQTLDSFPFLFFNSKFFVGDTKKINVSNENVYTTLLDEHIIPNMPKLLQPYLIGKGKKAEELAKTFYTDVLEIKDKLNEANMVELEKMFKNTPFEKCLGICKGE